ncbi:MAG: hypothetical protein ACLS69_01535 [Butyricicoccus sp.]
MENIRIYEEDGYIHFIMRRRTDAAALLDRSENAVCNFWTAG